jgi:hypothetical protein
MLAGLKISPAEAEAMKCCLAYGAALNEGRALFHPEDDKGASGRHRNQPQ